MTEIDRNAVLAKLGAHRPVTVELGCGPRKQDPHSIGIDAIGCEGVDFVGDAVEVLGAFPAGSVDLLTSSHFLEHVPEVGAVLDAMARVMRPGGTIEVVVPHFAHPYFASDPTHTHRFGLYTFSYLVEDPIFRRRVPGYVRRHDLRLREVDLVFKSTPPFYVRHAIKRVAGAFFNSCRYLQELHEENFCYVFPCYEIRFVMEKLAPSA